MAIKAFSRHLLTGANRLLRQKPLPVPARGRPLAAPKPEDFFHSLGSMQSALIVLREAFGFSSKTN
jgi:hypothetical protein